MNQITTNLVKEKLAEVMDPELGISIIDLGLVYKIKIEKNIIKIIMTLTTIGCPLFETIEVEVRDKLKEIGLNEKRLKLELTFDPPWTMDRMTERGKAMLGI